MADNPSAAWPMADEALAQQILDLVQQAGHYRQLKKGVYNGKSNSCPLTDSE
jgi:U4/U6 small nuclear ribonucleoprotein SNU13